MDMISTLPDATVSHILSFLPTKYAVRTSILSKKWKYLWTSITNLDFEENPDFDIGFDDKVVLGRTGFVYFVYRVLHLCHSAQIKKFLLCFKRTVHPFCVSEWIDEAIRRKVGELDLLNCHFSKLPVGFFSCKTITVLRLETEYLHAFDIPASLCLPNLKILQVHVDSPPNDLTQKLFRSCPLLEDLIIEGLLYIRHPTYDNTLVFDVSAPCLKSLEINLDGITDDLVHEILVNAPNLEYVNLNVLFPSKYTLGNFSSLVEAIVNVGEDHTSSLEYANLVFELLGGITSIKSLAFFSNTMAALDFAYGNKLPSFYNLIDLEVEIPGFCGWRVLPGLLESSPNLQVLILAKAYYDDEDDAVINEADNWIEPQSVPSCLLLHLKVIEMTTFQGKEYEMTVLKYLLAYAEVLKRLSINLRGLTSEEKVKCRQKLLEFPRGSRTCKIQFLVGSQ